HAGIAERGEPGRVRRMTDDRAVVELPVAAVQDRTERGLDDDGVRLGDRVRDIDELDPERADVEALAGLDQVDWDQFGSGLAGELGGEEARGERGGINRDP